MKIVFLSLLLAASLAASTMPLTSVSDVVYRADGTPAHGTVVISWPAFTSSDGHAVAAGSKSVTIATDGTLTVALTPNYGGTPAGSYYKVVYKLSDGSTYEESWSVPSVPTTTISAVRSKIVPSSVALQVASRQYIDSALTSKADNASVIHTTGNETISGIKQFAASPAVPDPIAATDVANKQYVDNIIIGRSVSSFNGRIGSVMPMSNDYAYNQLSAIPSSFTPSAHQHAATDITSGTINSVRVVTGTITKGKCLHTDPSTGTITETTSDCGSGSGSAPDASPSTKGILQLAGDLGGTAASPSVAKLGGMLMASNFAGVTADAKLSAAIAALPTSGGVVYLDSPTQTWTGCPTFGTAWVHIVLLNKPTINVDCTIPSNVVIQGSIGAPFHLTTGKKLTMLGDIVAGRWQIFENANPPGQGTVDFTGNSSIKEIYPEWWGASPQATAAVNTPALQSAVYGAFGTNRTNASGLYKWNKILRLADGCYQINDELKFYHVLNFKVDGEGKMLSCIQQTASNKRIIDGQSIAYGTFSNLSFQSIASQDATKPLVDLDYNGTQGDDLRPQFITFQDVGFGGGNVAAIGVLIAKSGGAAQGSNIVCYNCAGIGFTQAAWQIGTPTSYAQNALDNAWYQGDIQSSPKYGIAVYGGNVTVRDATMENGFSTQTGFDIYIEACQGKSVVENVRSESRKLIAGGCNYGVIVRDSFTIDQHYQPTPGSTYPGVGGIIGGSNTCGDGKYYTVTAATSGFGGVGGEASPLSATGGSAATVVKTGAGWTANQFQNMRVCLGNGGSGYGYYGVVTGNTTDTITVSSFLTYYAEMPAVTVDNTTKFWVEPNWGTQTSSGGMTWTADAENGIEGNLGGVMTGIIEDVSIPGLPIKFFGSGVGALRRFFTTRSDWANTSSGFPLDDLNVFTNFDDVRMSQALGIGGTTKYRTWHVGRNGAGHDSKNELQMGTKPVCWAMGGAGGGVQISDLCIDTDSADNSNYSGRLRIRVMSNTGTKYVYVTKEGYLDAPGYNLNGLALAFSNLSPATNNTSVNLGVKAAGGSNYCSYKVNTSDQIEFTCPIKAGTGTPALQGTPAALPAVNSGDAQFGIDSDGKFKVREVSSGTTGAATEVMKVTTPLADTQLPTKYKTVTCQPGLGDGRNAMGAGAYSQSACLNEFGATFTITAVKCYTDNNGASTLSATNGAGTALLTAPITCTNSFAAGTQSATITIAPGDFVKFSFTSDGTSKQTTWVVTGTR